MTLPKFERLALWESSDGKCRWCGCPVFYGAFQEDHVIPRSLKEGDPVRLDRIRQTRNLARDFDLESLENIVVSCGPCNNGKGCKLPPEAHAMSLMLEEVRRLAPLICRQSQVYRQASEIEKAVAVLEGNFQDPIVAQRAVDLLDAVEELRARSAHAAFGRALIAQDWITYEWAPGSKEAATHRRVWLVQPPGHVRVAVVLEAHGEPGTVISVAAEVIANLVESSWPGSYTVLHYFGERPGASWDNYWGPVLKSDSGDYEFPVHWDDERAQPARKALIAAGVTDI